MASTMIEKVRTKMDDKGSIGVISIYVLQACGEMTHKEVRDVLREKCDIEVNLTLLRNTLNDLKRRNLLSNVQKENHETHDMEDAYAVRDVKFSGSPELAQLKTILPTILESDDAKRIKAFMEGQEEAGERKSKKPVYCEYRAIKVTFTNVQPICGTDPNTDKKRDEAEKAGEKGVVSHCILPRDHFDRDKIFMPATWFKGWIRSHARTVDMGDSVSRYLGISRVSFKPEQPLIQVLQGTAPQEGRGGVGITKYEALQPGEEWDVIFNIPTKGFMSVPDFLDLLLRISALPKCGIGGYHEKNGRIKMTGFEEIGDLNDNTVFVEYLEEEGHEDLLKVKKQVDSIRKKYEAV